jgi:hypothetical protein
MSVEERIPERVDLEIATAIGSQAVVRAFLASTCRAWSIDGEVASDCAIAVSEVLAWSGPDRLTISVTRTSEGDALEVSCAGVHPPPTADEGDRMRSDLLEALTRRVEVGDTGVTLVFSLE